MNQVKFGGEESVVTVHDLREKASVFLTQVPMMAFMAKKKKIISGSVIVEPTERDVVWGDLAEEAVGRKSP